MTESNSSRFVIERSVDGVHYGQVATLAAAGHSNQILHYKHFDDRAPQGVVYYRILQEDSDGTKVYSDVKSVYVESEFQINIKPNPNHGHFEVSIKKVNKSDVKIRLLNLLGIVVFEQEIINSVGSVNKDIDISHLPSAVYMLEIKLNEKTYLRKVIKD